MLCQPVTARRESRASISEFEPGNFLREETEDEERCEGTSTMSACFKLLLEHARWSMLCLHARWSRALMKPSKSTALAGPLPRALEGSTSPLRRACMHGVSGRGYQRPLPTHKQLPRSGLPSRLPSAKYTAARKEARPGTWQGVDLCSKGNVDIHHG